MLALGVQLCRNYRAARIAFGLDPWSDAKLGAFEDARDAVQDYLMADGGHPLEDLEHLTEFTLDSNLEVLEGPLAFDRFTSYRLYGAASVAPGFRRIA